jgi:hypothetical protein
MKLLIFSLALFAPCAGWLDAATQPGRVVIKPEDTGAVLVNPGMGWVLHYYAESLAGCGSRLQSLENTYEAFTTSLITNDEVIAADQEAGKGRQLFLSVESAQVRGAWPSSISATRAHRTYA